MLVHICCSVDSHYFLQRLKEDYPQEKLIGYFYDPNIHPYSEYRLRLLDVQRSCDMLNVELIEGEYDLDSWFEATRGLEDEPEKGKRCSVCFDHRFAKSAQKAKELGEKTYTSTLLTSPKKSIEQLTNEGEREGNLHEVSFISVDYRKDGGTQEQMRLARQDMLYHQNYCGCVHALKKQRDQQDKLEDELFVDIANQLLPESIEEKIMMYEERINLEKQNINYKIRRDKFLNYRLLRGYVKFDRTVVPSYILPYSTTTRQLTKTKLAFSQNEIFYLNRDEIIFITLSLFNRLANTNFNSVKELLKHPLKFQQDLLIKEKITHSTLSLSTVVVVDTFIDTKIELYLNSKTYQDVKEVLVK